MKVKEVSKVNETSEPWWSEEGEAEEFIIDELKDLYGTEEREAPVSGFIVKQQWVHPEMETTGGPIDAGYSVYPAEWDDDEGWTARNESDETFETLAEAKEHLKSMSKPCPAW